MIDENFDDRRLKRILDFLLLTDRFKTIERKRYIADGSRRETDARCQCRSIRLLRLSLRNYTAAPTVKSFGRKQPDQQGGGCDLRSPSQ